jgi:hypothetical protein
MANHTAQKHFQETEDCLRDFIAMMQERTVDQNRDNILNMDETPIAYSYHSNKSLDTKGFRTIHVCASMTDTKRVTVMSTVTASGKMHLPLMIFKGAPNGCIASHEFVTYPATKKHMPEEGMNG